MLNKTLFEIVKTYPEKTALVYDTLRISYKQLYADIIGFSKGLTSIGADLSGCIAFVLPNCIEFVIGFYSVAHLESIVLPINPLLKKEEIKSYVDGCNTNIIITNIQHLAVCLAIISELDRGIKLILVDGHHPSAYNFYDLIITGAEYHERPNLYEGDVLYQYSSGSTGKSKRVTRTQKNLFHEALNFTTTVKVTSNDNILSIVPMFHAHGLGNCLLAATTTGATLTILEPFLRNGVPIEVPFVSRCQRIFQLIENEKITIMPAVPYIFSALTENPLDAQANLSSLRLCFSAGNFLPKKTFDDFLQRFGISVKQLYGCTEAGSLSINLDADVATTHNSVGLPLRNVEIKILDDTKKEVAFDCIGEIVVKSLGLTSGYFGTSDLNKEVFKNGYFFTGDLGKKDKDGRLYITGRKKIFIDTGGYKVDPLEIEDILITHPAVKEAVVVGIEALYGGEIIKAVIVLKGDCNENEIMSYCQDRLADFKVPRIVEFINEIPKSPLGKILRKDLVQKDTTKNPLLIQKRSVRWTLADVKSKEQLYSLLKNHLREQLSEILRLDLSLIDLLKPLSDFGLNSVMAVELKVRLENTLGIALSATLVWNYPTIAELARYLAEMLHVKRSQDSAVEADVSSEQKDDPSSVDLAAVEQLSDDAIKQLIAYETEIILQRISGHSIDSEQEDDM